MSDPQKNPRPVDAHSVYDISFNKNKDAEINQFITDTLGKKSYPTSASYNEYAEKISVKDLLARYAQINQLSETDDIKYHFKLFVLMITMGNTNQDKHNDSVVNALITLGQRLKKPANEPAKNSLYTTIGNKLADVLFYNDFLEAQAGRKKAYFNEALVGVISNLKTECRTDEGKDLYAKMMLKFLHVKDETLKDSITVKLGGSGPIIYKTNP